MRAWSALARAKAERADTKAHAKLLSSQARLIRAVIAAEDMSIMVLLRMLNS
jgi:hypothetical protein